MQLNDRELATVMAALRLWQEDSLQSGNEVDDLPASLMEYFQEETPLTPTEIDDLIWRLGTSALPDSYICGKYTIEVVREDAELTLHAQVIAEPDASESLAEHAARIASGRDVRRAIITNIEPIRRLILTEDQLSSECDQYDQVTLQFNDEDEAELAENRAREMLLMNPRQVEMWLDDNRKENEWEYPTTLDEEVE